MNKQKLESIKAKLEKTAISYQQADAILKSQGFDKFDLELDEEFKNIVKAESDDTKRFELCVKRVEQMLADEPEDAFTLHYMRDTIKFVDKNEIQEAIAQILEDEEISNSEENM